MRDWVLLVLLLGPSLVAAAFIALLNLPLWLLAPFYLIGSLLCAWYSRALTVRGVAFACALWLYLGTVIFVTNELIVSDGWAATAFLLAVSPLLFFAIFNESRYRRRDSLPNEWLE